MIDVSQEPLPRLPKRRVDSHKSDYGRALIIGGSLAMAGAPAMAAVACLRSGAGLTSVAAPRSVHSIVAAHHPAYTTHPLADDGERITLAACDALARLVAASDAVAIGPGLDRSGDIEAVVQRLYGEVDKPLVVDADGLNSLAENTDVLAQPAGPRLLTPHAGEFARLAGSAIADPNDDEQRLEAASRLAARDASGGAVVLLKGPRTVVTDGARYSLNRTGNPGMATGGSGDVLTGIATGLIAQGMAVFDAARLAAYVHGLAGDLAAEKLGETSLIATDLIDFLPHAWREIDTISGKRSRADSRFQAVQIYRQIADPPNVLRGGALAIGNFDGVHRGHAQLVERLVRRAEECGGPAVVFTFDPHPVRLLRPEQSPPPLTWTERKAELLSDLGVDAVIAYPTDMALLRLSAQEFFELIVMETLSARALVEGPNFFFGRGREGNVELLAKFCNDVGLSLDVVQPNEREGEMISSSRIRELVGDRGDVATAMTMLTSPYRLRGIVTHGAGRGAAMGTPTANLEGIDTLLPAHGVYAAVARVKGGVWPAAVNIGPNPTFDDDSTKVEAHLIDCKESLYGKPMELDFLDRLREVRRFDSKEQLIEQIESDVQRTRQVFRQTREPNK